MWQIWVDTGGTFTDCLARDPRGTLHRAKVLSSGLLRGRVTSVRSPTQIAVDQHWAGSANGLTGLRLRPVGASSTAFADLPLVERFDPDRTLLTLSAPLRGILEPGDLFELGSGEEAPLLAARLVTGTAVGHPFPPIALRLATTRGTNALLERRGARTALFVTKGFGDLLAIGTQQRPELFAQVVRKRRPIYDATVEVDERLAADGSVLRPFDATDELRERAIALRADGVEVAAIALVNAYRDPRHEQALARVLSEVGFRWVRSSTELSPLLNLLRRAETAVVDGYLTPIIEGFLARVHAAQEHPATAPTLVMTSAGGLVRADAFTAKDSLLSGPAAGVVGAASTGASCGHDAVIAFDMGGTSTDVARFHGRFDYRFEQQVGDAKLATTALAIESVAAGGGSICRVEEGRLHVGPQSAGAQPGPACYGAGGPLTLTDVNLLLGRVDEARFGIPVYRTHAEAAIDRIKQALHEQTGQSIERDDLLEGFLDIANERMAETIRQVSLRRGYEPADHALVAFGGAGPQHACGVARRLGMNTILIPADAGLLSALGLGQARVERLVERQVLRQLDAAASELPDMFGEMADEARDLLRREGIEADEVAIRRQIANLRYEGQESTIPVEHDSALSLDAAFATRYAELYGYQPESRPIEVESLRVVAGTRSQTVGQSGHRSAAHAPQEAPTSELRWLRARFGRRWRNVPCYNREELLPDTLLDAPCVVMDAHSTTVVAPGWRGAVHANGTLLLKREDAGRTAARTSAGAPPPEAVQLELFANRLIGIAEEMGEMLRRTALSTNVKERLDFSCAVLDASGELVVNAPHIPVHLGSLGLCVRRVREAIAMRPGDVVITNHPAYGGSHLPDVTVIAPVFHDGTLLGYVANRAHHAEIGGSCPGSMPPRARCLAEEGVVIAPRYLLEAGRAHWPQMRALLLSGPWPSRAVEENLADLRAAVAAVTLGNAALRELAAGDGPMAVLRYMARLKDLAAAQVARALARLPRGEHQCTSTLDDGTPLRVSVTVGEQQARFDFRGCGPRHPGNLNTTPAVVRSAVIYVLRLLIDRPLPLNEGLMRAVTVDLERGLLDPGFADDPRDAPAVVGGNVETSQRLVDCLLEALGMAANSQGTMNNVLFGNDRFGYYETICGGSGASPQHDGASAVHTHMTNTRITDVELLEHRYPVRLDRFAIRHGSGGAGQHRGGDGVVRELTFLAPLDLSILSQRRATRPRGLAGGSDGASGSQRIIRVDGMIEQLEAIDGRTVESGDRLLIETPGGGGYGLPSGSAPRKA